MNPNDSINNNSPATNPNFQQPTNPMPETTQGSPVTPMAESLKQPSAIPPSSITNSKAEQNTQKVPRHIEVLPKICLALGIITVIGTIFTVLGLISGWFLFNQGSAMVSSLLLGMTYSAISQNGTILCVATLIASFFAKKQHHISVKKPVLITIISIFMIHIPTIIIYCIQLIARMNS